jgi:8-oxo-dGTP pyrophosphatase MutT (NUDIX family)
MRNHPILGWPIVTANDCFQVIRSAGIKPWPKLGPQVPLSSYIENASPEQLKDVHRFAPQTFAVQHQNPYDGSTFNAFRTEFKPFSLVILIIDDNYIAVTAEWKHGNDRITIVPVCGVAGKNEDHFPTLAEKMKATAIRECKEETGLDLETLTPLSSNQGMWYSVRNSETRCFPYLGKVKPYTERGPTKFDKTEHLLMVLFKINEWFNLIEDDNLFGVNPDFCLEDCSRSSTYVAMRKLGKLTLT